MRNLTFEFIDIPISEKWNIEYNKLTNLNPEDKSLSSDELEYYSLGLLTEDLLQIKSKSHFIDLGWYPDSELTGEYHLMLLHLNSSNQVDWDNTIFELKTRRLDKVLFCIEIITNILKE